MSCKKQLCDMVEKQPRTTAELALALGLKISTMSVRVAAAQRLGVIKPVGELHRPHRKAVIIWGPA